MDLMVRMSRHTAAVAVRVVAVLLVGAGALAVRTVRQRLQRMLLRAGPTRPERTGPGMTSQVQAGPAEAPLSSPSQSNQVAEEG
jgi:hypothetical protein